MAGSPTCDRAGSLAAVVIIATSRSDSYVILVAGFLYRMMMACKTQITLQFLIPTKEKTMLENKLFTQDYVIYKQELKPNCS